MTGFDIALCLNRMGFPPNCWRDETSAEAIIRTWDNSIDPCPYSSVEDMIVACQDILPQIQAEQNAEKRREALSKLDPIVVQIQRYEILGEDSTQARIKLSEAMDEVNSLYPQPQ